jgi:hypothetical protein
MFQLNEEEKEQVVAICDHLKKLKYSPYLPYVFTEHGVIMLASILNSERAIRVSIRIVETFIKMREMIQVSTGLILQLEKLEQRYQNRMKKSFSYSKFLRSSNRTSRMKRISGKGVELALNQVVKKYYSRINANWKSQIVITNSGDIN